jgi:hypothetical protein
MKSRGEYNTSHTATVFGRDGMVKGDGDSGLVGVILFCPFLFASIYHTTLAYHRLQSTQNPKFLFYLSLSAYALLELIYFAGLFYYHQLVFLLSFQHLLSH